MTQAEDHGSRDHAALSPSGAHRWVSCPGSVEAEKGLPGSTSPFAEEGTAAHELSEHCLRRDLEPKIFIGEVFNGITVDEEMAEAARVYVEHVNSIPGARLIEKKVSLGRWVPESFGTADTIVVDEDHLHVIDLKYGKGLEVVAEENLQGLLYALGAYDLVAEWSDIKWVSIHICQPRIRRMPSMWSLKTEELLVRGEALRAAAQAALADNAPRVPSEKACQWCKAKGTCKALAEASMAVAQIGFEDLAEDKPTPNKGVPVKDMTWDEISRVLQNVDMLMTWAGAVKDHAYKSALAGTAVPGYKLVNGRAGARSWAVDTREVFRHGMGLGYDEDALTVKKPISPTQLEKVVGKDKFADEFADIVTRPSPKPALVVLGDKRSPIVVDRTEGFE